MFARPIPRAAAMARIDAPASRSRFTVEASRLPESSPILSSSSTSSAPLPRATERLRRSVGSSTPCMASSASMLPAAFGAVAERGSSGVPGVSGNEKPVELVRRVWLAGDPSVVPFGP